MTEEHANNTDRTPGFFRLATLNVQGTTAPATQSNLIMEAMMSNIDILMLTETKYDPPTHKNFGSPPFDFAFISHWSHDPNFPNGSGIGFLLSKSMSAHFGPPRGINGYLMILDMFFHTRQRIRFINIYNPHGQERSRVRENINNMINHEITDASTHNYHIITAGDFNWSLERDTEENHIYSVCMQHNMTDISITENAAPPLTFFGAQGRPSRLDYILISSELSSFVTNTITKRSNIINSDHAMIIADILAPTLTSRNLQKKYF
jgi:exonuclease III